MVLGQKAKLIVGILHGLSIILSMNVLPTALAQVADASQGESPDTSEVAAIPAIFRTPETGLGLGVAVIYTHDTSVTKPSPIISGLMYSEKQQLLWVLGSKQTFDNGRFALIGYTEITQFPQKFFGIGNQTSAADEELYEERRQQLDLGGEVQIYQNLSLGLKSLFRHDTNSKFEDSGKLATGSIPGYAGGTQRGFETFLYWETADDNFYPSHGNKVTIAYRNFMRGWGSSHPFDGVRVDARDYRLLGAERVLATNLIAQSNNSGTPFYQMAQLGGNDVLRGYFKGRYRDNKMAILQTELRQALSERWRFAVFGGVGHVAHAWDSLRMKSVKASYGAGFRYQITPKQKINLRLDLGLGEPKDGPALYVYVMEAY